MIFLQQNDPFPNVDAANADGLLAVGGNLSVERLNTAYRSGIFPWYEEDQPILWWSPDPRMVLFPKKFKVSKSLKKTVASQKFKITFNNHFSEMIDNCAAIARKGQAGTWITQEMKQAYCKLHELGMAKSVEAWHDGKLVGGLYGIDLPDLKVFCGESMFSKVTDASKVAFYHLVEMLHIENYSIIDCQVYTQHLESLGAEQIPRKEFLQYLKS